jgi:pimeloyl-ACP methyl ester carboxylesterase
MLTPFPIVFLHGAGRAGASNWPAQAGSAETRFHFLDRDAPFDDAERDAGRLIKAVGSGGHVVAHSYGAIAAMLAAARSSRIRSLVLVEPACFSIARGRSGAELT